MKHLKNFDGFMNESSGCPFAASNEEEYEVFPQKLADMLNFVGDGVSSIFVISESASHNGEKYWTNTVEVEFAANANGNITFDEWSKAGDAISQYVGTCGVAGVTVLGSKNRLEIEFGDDRPLVGKDWHAE